MREKIVVIVKMYSPRFDFERSYERVPLPRRVILALQIEFRAKHNVHAPLARNLESARIASL